MNQITPEELKLYGNVEAVEEHRIYKKFAHSPRHHQNYYRLMYFEFDQRVQVGDFLTERELRPFERQRHTEKERITRLMKTIAPRPDHFFLDEGCGVGQLSDEEKRAVLQEVYRVLKPSGEVFFHTPNKGRIQLGLLKRRLLALLHLENPLRIRHHYAEGGGHVGLTTPSKLIPMLTASGFDCSRIYCPGDIPILKGLSRPMNDLLSANTPGLRDFMAANFVLIRRKRIS